MNAKKRAEKIMKLDWGCGCCSDGNKDDIKSSVIRELESYAADLLEQAAMICRDEYGADMDQSWIDCASFLEAKIRALRKGEG